MSKDGIILTTLSFVFAFFLFRRFIEIYKKMKNMIEIEAIVTDVIVRTTYNRKYYMYYYSFVFGGNEYTIEDKKRTPWMHKKIVINQTILMYILPDNPKEYISPMSVLTYKYYLLLAICFIVLPLLLLH